MAASQCCVCGDLCFPVTCLTYILFWSIRLPEPETEKDFPELETNNDFPELEVPKDLAELDTAKPFPTPDIITIGVEGEAVPSSGPISRSYLVRI